MKFGNIVLNNGNLIGGNFILDMNAVVADDLKDGKKKKLYVENHLKSDDFFDVKHYPAVFFKNIFAKRTSGKYKTFITGNLTIKNITNTTSFPAKVVLNGDQVGVSSSQFTFNRKDFGLNYDVFEDMVIKNDVEANVRFNAK